VGQTLDLDAIVMRRKRTLFRSSRLDSTSTSSSDESSASARAPGVIVQESHIVPDVEKKGEEKEDPIIKIRRRHTRTHTHAQVGYMSAMLSTLRRYGVNLQRWFRVVIWRGFILRWLRWFTF
jgi:hypothetical protein